MDNERIPEKLVRVEYGMPPTRGIWSTWFEDHPDRPDDDYRAALLELHPYAVVRKIERGLSPVCDGGKGGCA